MNTLLVPPLALSLLPAALSAQDTARAAADSARAPFACEEQGLRDGAPFGCQLLARPSGMRFPAGPVFWHLARYPSREAAQAAGRFTDILTDITTEDGAETWLHRFGAEGDVPRGGAQTTLVGPLPLPRGSSFRIDVFHVVMPAGARTAVHAHPGPEAWYLLEGEQCVETSKGVVRGAAGEGVVSPPAGVPMQVVNSGTGTLRALSVLIRDDARPRATPSRWKPKGACDAPAGG